MNFAVMNNALWCDEVLRAQGQATEFCDGYWICHGEGLPFYPAIVTLSPTIPTELKIAFNALPSGASVKDSFGSLDLGTMGFQKLFDATWLCRSPHDAGEEAAELQKAVNLKELLTWLVAWDEGTGGGKRIFSPTLLSRPGVSFVSVSAGENIVAGAITNEGPDAVIGISNLFGLKAGEAALEAVVAGHPDKPIVGYEGDEDVISIYERHGFERKGGLTIWLKS